MQVIKRNGTSQEVSFDKVVHRLKNLCNCLTIDPIIIAQKVCSRIYDGVSTRELDELSAQICTSMITTHLDYGVLGSRIIISNNHKNTSPSFSETIMMLYNRVDKNGDNTPMISDAVYNVVMKNKEKLNDVIDYSRDYDFDYFAFKTLERAYLFKIDNKIVERIQHLIMRVSLGFHCEDISATIRSYNYISKKYFTHATPTLFNSGTNHPQLLSCYLIGTEDTIEGIFKTISDCAKISKWAGGIGLHISNIRSKNALIRGTNGKSRGIIPMLKVYNETLKYINQGGKRAGSAAIYIEPHHPEILAFLELRKNHGNEEDRARDLFLALWISDLFMKKVERDEEWCLFDPDECQGLSDVWGEKYDELYYQYEKEGRERKKVPARTIWKYILNSQIETGTPYILFKDSANRKSNQQNLGTIKSSNLCVAPETLILTDKGHRVISFFENQYVNVWNGEQFSKSLVKKTGENQKLISVHLSNGGVLECTEYHKFFISNTENKKVIIEAKDLENGMTLWNCEYPRVNNDDAKEMKWYDANDVPLNSSIDEKEQWMLNNFGTDDHLYNDSIHFMERLRLMCQTIGLNGEYKYDDELLLYRFNLIQFNGNDGNANANNGEDGDHNIRVINVKDNGRISDTYCFNEPLKHAGIFNGIYTGQCAEILEYSDEKEYANCCLSSVCLPTFVDEDKKTFNHELLIEVCKTIVENLNKIIDVNYYPVPETKRSNMRHRPLGIGVQGLADVFCLLRIPFDGEEAKKLNIEIFETLYYGCCVASMELAIRDGPYETFNGSPMSEGLFQFDLWEKKMR